MDYTPFDDILKHIYELEGLVLVARKEDADRSMLLQMIREKVACIDEMLAKGDEPAALMPEQAASPQPGIAEYPMPDAESAEDNPVPALEPEADTTDEAPMLTDVSDSDDWDGSRHDSPEEPAAEMTFDYEEPAKIITDDGDTPAGTIDDNAGNDNYAPCRTEPESDNTNDNDGNGYADETVTVDALLQRNMSRDLKKAFTINDRFRYRRELFGNSDIEMNDALNLVEAMQSYSEAEEYFYDMLNWDKQSPEVADFMSIIRNHFYSK